MFDTLKRRFRDAGTLQTLFASAECHANEEGQAEPGAEHLVMAALEMPDGTAGRAFERVGANPAKFREAVSQQYLEALRTVGMEPSAIASPNDTAPVPRAKGVYKAQASAQALVQKLTETKPFNTVLPLFSAEILLAATEGQHTIAMRALRVMGVDRAALAAAARSEIAAYARQDELSQKR